MKAHIFLIANLKFGLWTPCIFVDLTENVKLTGIPINNLLLCIFIIGSFSGSHTFFCIWRVNKTLSQYETSQNAFYYRYLHVCYCHLARHHAAEVTMKTNCVEMVCFQNQHWKIIIKITRSDWKGAFKCYWVLYCSDSTSSSTLMTFHSLCMGRWV